MNTHPSPASLLLAPEAVMPDGGVHLCSNLIPERRRGVATLRVAPGIGQMLSGPFTPIALWHHPGGSHLDATLYSWRSQSDVSLWISEGAAVPYEIEHPSLTEIHCAIATPAGFTVMTSCGPLSLCPSSDGWVCTPALAPRIILPRLLTLTTAPLTARIEPRTFTKVTVTRTDVEVPQPQLHALASDLCAAYSSLASAAAHGSLWMQPVVARIILRDTHGNRILSSAPILSRASVQGTATLTALCSKPSADTIELPAITLLAEAYRLRIAISADCAAALNEAAVHTLEVWTAPQCHPVDPSADMPVRWTAISTAQPSLAVAVPGATARFASMLGTHARRLRDIASNAAPVLARRLTITAPFAQADVDIPPPAFESVEADNRLAARASALVDSQSPLSQNSSLLRSLLPPASFIARCGCVCGDKVMWADISPLSPPVADIGNICVFSSESAGQWTAEVRVNLRSGTQLAYTLGGTGAAPQAWAPLVAWPLATAQSIDVYLTRATTVTHGHIALEPSADGTCAISLDPALASRPWAAHTGAIPPRNATAASPHHTGAIAVAPLSAPALPAHALIGCPATIVALQPARRTFSAWDSAAARAYAFTPAGIFAVTAPRSAASAISVSLVHPYPVSSPHAVAPSPGGILVASGSSLLCLSGTSVSSHRFPFTIASVAWNYDTDAAWILDTRGNPAIYCPASRSHTTLMLPYSPERLLNLSTRLLLTSADAVWHPSHPASPVPVAWARTGAIAPGRRIRSISISASATSFKGSVVISVAQSTAPDTPAVATSLAIDGPIAHPLIMRLALPGRPFATVELQGTASPDFMLYGITLTLSPQ